MFSLDQHSSLLLHRYERRELEPTLVPEAESILSTLRTKMKSSDVGKGLLRFNPQKKSQLLLLLSESCNLGCSYCFMEETNGHKIYMDDRTAIKAIKQYPARGIKFFGGEPLMRFDVIKRVVEFANDHYVSELREKPPEYTVITNGTLINDEVASFMKENHFYVMVSIDGPRDVTDIQRPALSGRSTYDMVLEGLASLRKMGVVFSMQGTYTSNHIRLGYSVRDVIDHLVQLGAYRAHVEPAFGQSSDGFGGLYLLSKGQIDEVAREFRELAGLSIESMISERPLRVIYVLDAIKTIAFGKPNAHSCNAGIDNITVDAKGKAYPCYFLMQNELYMGSVHDATLMDAPAFRGTQDKMVGHRRNLIIPCLDCWARNLCTPCYGYEQASSKTLFESNPIPYEYCAVMRAVLEGAISKLSEIKRHPEKWAKLLCALDEGSKWVLN